MNKNRIHLLLGMNTLVLYCLIFFLMRDLEFGQLVVIGIAMAAMMIMPSLVINRALSHLERRATEAESELSSVSDELAGLKERFSSVTTLDELTGCYNETHFKDVLTQHRAMSERGSYHFTIAILQVDQFAEIVDSHGLGSGNETLQLFSRIVKAALREVDVIARMDNDIFALLLSGASEEDAVMIINRISQLISQIKIKDDDAMQVTASGGITTFHGTEDVDELMANASKALEFAVESGRDRVAGFNYKPPEELKETAGSEEDPARV
ncbi:MAG: GGDEF domain-containing protein [Pseudomonadales bacterium]|nr:GGDEF domain-containing protein [Pseudomonadales bacterium]MBO6597431.1 GGDEF domain-containing protein [Pseudomonadales bacterium]MBO6703074.1 GGDEF domain-containing protein [Pseudomonadales bacterium]MBO6824165.1 GGDEF domain-containing protein [Pseudomonadales bacterium]MBO7006285.1 GGDEF domain-containing protein [Pseudomonadales bacterium]